MNERRWASLAGRLGLTPHRRAALATVVLEPVATGRDPRQVHPDHPHTLWQNLGACDSGPIA